MRVAVVYESLFGNTHEIAESVADGIREARPEAVVECVPVGEAGSGRPEVDLLVVGGPTHFLGMTSERSRRMQQEYEKNAVEHGRAGHEDEPGAEGEGVRVWLEALPGAANGRHAAAFDTRLDKLMAGGAAKRIARSLRHHGYEVVAEPEGFIVEDMDGPLRKGESGRARAWGAGLVLHASHRPR
jgi:multimeric flavodoxin WrbA